MEFKKQKQMFPHVTLHLKKMQNDSDIFLREILHCNFPILKYYMLCVMCYNSSNLILFRRINSLFLFPSPCAKLWKNDPSPLYLLFNFFFLVIFGVCKEVTIVPTLLHPQFLLCFTLGYFSINNKLLESSRSHGLQPYHIETQIPIWSPKLSSIKPGHYLHGWPLRNTICSGCKG